MDFDKLHRITTYALKVRRSLDRCEFDPVILKAEQAKVITTIRDLIDTAKDATADHEKDAIAELITNLHNSKDSIAKFLALCT